MVRLWFGPPRTPFRTKWRPAAFSRLMRELSEEGAYFRFQFMSKERAFPAIIPVLK